LDYRPGPWGLDGQSCCVYCIYTETEGAITIVISQQSPEPIYRQIEEQVKAALFSGELAPGTELPSIRKLAQDLRISVITTKRAYEELERGGFIVTLPARGSFAADPDRDALRERRLGELKAGLAPLAAEARALGLGEEGFGAMAREAYLEANKEHEDA